MKEWVNRERWLLVAIIVVAIAVRLVYSFAIARGVLGIEPQNESTDGYHLIAQSLYAGDGYKFRADQHTTMQRPPGYPAFLVGIFELAGVDYWWVQVAQALLATVSCLFLFLLGRWVHSPAVGLMAAAMFALYPNSIIYSARLYSENLYFPLFLGFAYFLCRASIEGSAARGAAAGILWGAGLLTRGTLLPLPAVMPFGILVSPPHRSRWVRWAIPALLAGLTVVVPWTVRNYSLSGSIVPVSSWTWTPMYNGAMVSKGMIGWKELSDADNFGTQEVRNRALEKFGYAEGKSVFADVRDEVRLDAVGKEMTTALWRADPIAVIGQALAGVVFTWFLTFDTGTRLASLAIHLPLLALFVTGAVMLWRSDREAFARAWPALALILFVNAFHALAFPHVRYMSPAIALSFLFSALPILVFAHKVLRFPVPVPSEIAVR